MLQLHPDLNWKVFKAVSGLVKLHGRVRWAQNNVCYLCGKYMFWKVNLDHVLPRKRGGGAWPKLVTHVKCNTDKGHRHPYPCELLYLEGTLLRVLDYRDEDFAVWTADDTNRLANRLRQ